MLTSYGGTAITYDQIGNPLTYYNGSAYTFTWEGRKLVGATKGSNNLTFVYNDEGIRTSKTVNGVKHTYYLNGSQIVAEQWADKLLVFTYDASGSPIGMSFRKDSYAADQWDVYWFEKNLQGDITSVYNSSGVQVATYSYTTAWGEHSAYLLDSSEVGASYNPFRYRGYYYDVDLEMYYLQSRYYDSKICRFINSDSALYSTMLGCNLFAYCENNPVTRSDPSGRFWFCDDIDLDEDDFMERGGGGGSGYGYGSYGGYGSAYHNYAVRTNTAAYNANLGGYYSPGPTSAMINPNAYTVLGAVIVTDDMATSSGGIQTKPGDANKTGLHGNSLQSTKTNYGYALVDSQGNILKFGETINPTTRYSQSYLTKNNITMKILVSGSKVDIHFWQHDMNEYYRYKYGIYPPLNKKGW